MRNADTEVTMAGHEAWLSPASYWPPPYLTTTAWLRHAPFAAWIVDAVRPRTITELGTHWGFSFFTFSEAVRRLGIPSSTFALDTWEGEEHAGRYGEEVFDFVRGVIETRYSSFATMLRGYFDDSVERFADGSIDLLHIDGRHRLEDVTHDFETWLPKVSDRGVVLFHDVCEHRDDFGVWEFWESVSARYPSFTFTHEHGLGVLGVGTDLPEPMTRFFAAAEEHADEIRQDYETLGEVLAREDARRQTIDTQRHDINVLSQRVNDLKAELENARDEAVGLHQQIDELRGSTSWKVTAPLRGLTGRFRH